jgi:hypothetical protein
MDTSVEQFATIRVEPVTTEIDDWWASRYNVPFPGTHAIVRRRDRIVSVHGETGTPVVLDRMAQRCAGSWCATYLPPVGGAV